MYQEEAIEVLQKIQNDLANYLTKNRYEILANFPCFKKYNHYGAHNIDAGYAQLMFLEEYYVLAQGNGIRNETLLAKRIANILLTQEELRNLEKEIGNPKRAISVKEQLGIDTPFAAMEKILKNSIERNQALSKEYNKNSKFADNCEKLGFFKSLCELSPFSSRAEESLQNGLRRITDFLGGEEKRLCKFI